MPGSNEFSLNRDSGNSGNDAFQDVSNMAAQAQNVSSGNYSGLIGSVLNFFDGIINRRFNAREAQKARDWQEEMWNKNNQYNSPEALRQRYEDAGMNPYLMYGSGDSQGSASIPTASIGAQSSHHVDYYQAAVTSANARLLGAEASNQEVENMYQEMRIFKEFEKMDASTQLAFAKSKVEDVNHKILLNEFSHWNERFDRTMRLIDSESDEYKNLDNYRQAMVGIERIRAAVEKNYKEASVLLEEERNTETMNQNIRYLQFMYIDLIEKLNQADDHFQRAQDFAQQENKKDRTVQYVHEANDLIQEAARDVVSLFTFGISNIGRTTYNSGPGPVANPAPGSKYGVPASKSTNNGVPASKSTYKYPNWPRPRYEDYTDKNQYRRDYDRYVRELHNLNN